MTDPRALEHAGEILRQAGICAYPQGDELVLYRASSSDHWQEVQRFSPTALRPAYEGESEVMAAVDIVQKTVAAEVWRRLGAAR